MDKKNLKIKSRESSIDNEIIFPEESATIIDGILDKYGLRKIQEEGIKKFLKATVGAEKRKLFENLPGFKISSSLRGVAFGKISLENLPSFLEKELKVSQKTAKEITKDLQEKILAFVKIKEEELPPTKDIEIETPPSSLEDEEKKKESSIPDTYRESIE